MKNKSSKSELFLMELILSILFFSLAGAVCIQMFVRSHLLSNESVELNHAVEWCQNIAEGFYGCEGNVTELVNLFDNLYSDTSTEDNDYILPLNSTFEPVTLSMQKPVSQLSSTDCSYYIIVNFSEEKQLLHCHIETYKNDVSTETESADKLIYELDNVLFSGKEAANGK